MRTLSIVAVVGALLGTVVPAPATAGGQAASPVTPANEASAPRVPLPEFKKLYDAGAVIVLDVRGAQAYREGHIPGAVSAPLGTLASRAATWQDATKPIVAYCS